jgi:hypothetical protein
MNPKSWKAAGRIAAGSAMGLVVLAAAVLAFDPLLHAAQDFWPQVRGLRIMLDAVMGALVGLACIGILRLFRANSPDGTRDG